ncbi:Protein dispatched -like protein 1 [Toxocara canis]|uniref:Protein dispatched-like protein 1 n=1 Tax=Toxocara canis TaxID=6265 RepID=A0A0B2VLT0_TOXCA|nr:Protein dispatched -like protein 1 [Toxocara canis]
MFYHVLRMKLATNVAILRENEEYGNYSDIVVAYDEYGVDPDPTLDDIHGACDQYFALGTFIPYNYMEYLAKVVFRVTSFDNLFTMKTMRRLCHLDTIVDQTLASSSLLKNTIKKLPYSFNLPYYTMCPNMHITSNSCDSLNEDDIQIFRTMVTRCAAENPPSQCSSSIARQLTNMIFSKHKRPILASDTVYIAAVLPIIVSSDGSQDFDFYDALLKKLQQYYRRGDLVLVIFRVTFFPFLNLLAIVLIVAVGADDAFLFLYQFRKHKQEMKAALLFMPRRGDDEATSDDKTQQRRRECLRRCLNEALSHAAIAMLVTSATTAVAFYANLASKIVVLRWLFIPLSLVAFAISIYAIVNKPGIRLPERNSMQLLRSNQAYEWFDENSAALFDFSMGQKLKMNLLAVWGIQPTTTASALLPSKIGSLKRDIFFERHLSNNLLHFEALSSHPLTKCFLKFAEIVPFVSFTDVSLTAVDGPIFDKNGHLIAYFLMRPTTFNLSIVYDEMKPFFEFLTSAQHMLNEHTYQGLDTPMLQTSCDVTALYDLLERLLNGTTISVLISLLVSTLVIAFTTFHLILSVAAIFSIAIIVVLTLAIVLWCGWTINVVEATIIVLTIGLSFDYSLHVAVGFKLSKNYDYRNVSSTVGVPVLLAALSSFLAGLALIGANTQAFFEISAFLMLMTSLSVVVALFLLPSILTVLLRRSSLNVIRI